MENETIENGRKFYAKRRRTLISCTECHRRKQKCNRRQPCQNCVKRCKLELCRYEKNANRASSPGKSSITPPTRFADPQSMPKVNQLSSQDHKHLVSTLGYSIHNVHNTLGLVKKIGPTNSPIPSSFASADASNRKQTVLDDTYRSLVRQLPSKEYVDTLVQQYFSEINWQYDVLDEITFHRHLERWRAFPYSIHMRQIGSLPANIIAFPSLVFQLMAHSLLHRPVGNRGSSSLEYPRYALGMTSIDLAFEYSEIGYSLIESLKKSDISVVAVQVGILRASFLKNTGSVIEAWHVISTTIRNAQEIGLHASVTSLDPSMSIDAQWDHEVRRRVWFVLHNWDIHMAVVLGRPVTAIMAAEMVDIPDDFAEREIGISPRERTDQDAPTPFSVIRIGYNVAYQYFPRVRELETRGARRQDYHVVRETHAAIRQSMDRIPRWCHHDSLDVNFDDFPTCHWLPAARCSLLSGIHFVLLSLHRPYIFSIPESRIEALKAALMIFASQHRLFHLSEPKQYLSFNMVYPLFDAMVISLAILVLFPNENLDLRSRSIADVYHSVEILTKIGQYNALARSANSVIETLLCRLHERPEHSFQRSNHSSEDSAIARPGSAGADLLTIDNGLNTSFTTDLSDFLDIETLLPPHPVSDLFYGEVYVPAPDNALTAETSTESLQIDGHYPDDSFWGFVNDLNRT